MKKIIYFLRSLAISLMPLTALVALGTLPLSISAAILWPQPLTIFTAKNYMFQGHTALSPDGSYALIWSMMTEGGDRQLCFQRFNFNDQPLNPQPVIISGTIGKVPWRFIRGSNGNYFVIARGNQQSLLLLIDPNGNLLSEPTVINWSISSQSRVELVPDLSGGAWLGLQIERYSTRRINHFNSSGQAAVPGFLEIPTNNNLFSDMSILVQPDNSVICAYTHQYEARILKISSNVQITQDTSFSFSNDNMLDCKVFQDSAGNLIWVARIDAFLYLQNIQAMKTNDQGTLLWAQAISFSNPSGTVKAWDAVAMGDDTYAFAMVTQSSSSSPELICFSQRFNGAGSTFFGYNNRQRALEPLDAEAAVQLKLLASAGGGSWALIRKYDPNDWIYKLGCLYVSPNGINWAGEQVIHSEPWHNLFGEIGLGGFQQGSNLAMFAQTHANRQAVILRNTISTAGSNLAEVTLATSETAILDEHTIQPVGSNIFCAWSENREPYLWPQRKDTIRYQLVNSLGEKLLPQDGEIISGGSPKDLDKLGSLSLPDGNLLLWWVEYQTPYLLRAQLISPAGSPLWEEGGRLIVSDEVLRYCSIMASFYQGDIYFAWDRYFDNEIRGQRLVNGIAQWETDGRVLMNSATILYPSPNGVKLNALDGNTLIYACGDTYDTAFSYATCIVMWRFDSSGTSLPGFGQGGVPVLRHYNENHQSLEFFRALPCPSGLIVSAYTWDGYYEQSIFDYVYFVTGTIHQMVSPEGSCAWTADGLWSPQQLLPLATDASGYYAFTDNRILKRDYSNNQIWSEYLGRFVEQAVETRPGVYIGIADGKYYFSFTDHGDLSWPGDAQYTNNYLPETKLCAQGGDAYMLWKQKPTNNSSYDYNASPLLLQGFTRTATPLDDPHIPALSDLVSLSSAPNPFRNCVSLLISCKETINCELAVYNLRGQKIRDLHKGDLPQGASAIGWDGKDAGGSEVSAGIYIIRFQSQGLKPIIRKLMKL